ncbi:MAG: hypothetical protein J6S00_00805 [Clostridia bacterium]|nr:hypothetical protein [Clostridia bacterium]
MSVRKINYTVEQNGVSPETSQWGGIQYENNATTVAYALEPSFAEKLKTTYDLAEKTVYRIDFDSPAAGYHPSENIMCENNVIARDIPLVITMSGEPFQSTLVITWLDGENNEIGTFYSRPSRIYFDSVAREQYAEQEMADNISALEETVDKKHSEVLDAASRVSADAAIANEAMQKTLQAKLALESGAEIIFLGGDAESQVTVEFAVDGSMSEISENAVQNRVIVNELKNYALKDEVDSSIEVAMESVIGQAVTEALNVATSAAVSQAILEAKLVAHPVGSYYFSADPTNPSQLFGGVWQSIKDTFILAAGDKYTVGDIGGEEEVALTEGQLPKTYGLIADMVLQAEAGIGVGGIVSRGYSVGTASKVATSAGSTTHTHTEGVEMYSDRAEINFGNNEPHNNMPPYIVAYCWQRTA